MKNPFYFTKLFFLLLVLSFSSFNPILGIDYVFSGIGNYTDVSLWSPSYPGTNISTGNTVTIVSDAECTVQNGTFLFVTGTLINDGSMIFHNTFGCFNNGSFINNGTFFNEFAVDNLGDITNNGHFTVEGNFSTQSAGNFINAPNAVFINHGNFIASNINGNTHTFEGLFKGQGEIFVEDFQNEGIIAPGFSPGKITFKNDLNLESTGKLQIEIAGNAGVGVSGGHDQIEVLKIGNTIGDINIDGDLEVILLNGFMPEVGDQWIIATGTTAGTFSNLILPSGYTWNVDIQTSAIVLEIIAVILPVEMTFFNGEVLNQDISLFWQTSAEINNKGWDIEHSENLRDWQTIGFIPGQGNSSNENAYSFIHKNPNRQHHYYRLQQIDQDGQKSLSKVIYVELETTKNNIQIYPNPSYGKLYFSDYVEEVTVLDQQGKILLQVPILGQKINLDFLSSGLYFISINTEKKNQVYKFLKK